MEFQNIVLLVTILLVAVAVYFTLTLEEPQIEEPVVEEVDTAGVEELLFKGLEFGSNQKDYVYQYSEVSDGYVLTYTLTKSGNRTLVEIENPLVSKEVYFLENDTVLCTDYLGDEVCSSVLNEDELENYLESFNVKFFDESRISKDKANMKFLLNKGYVILEPEIKENTGCSKINYVLDFRNITLTEAAQFSMGSNSPKVFDYSMCINNNTGYVHQKTFNYSVDGIQHDYAFNLISFQSFAPEIELTKNISEGAVLALRHEREKSIILAKCFTEKQGGERDKCISTLALELERDDLCSFAGERKDRCLVSIVPLTKDDTICEKVVDPNFKDDCYIELGGALKNETYCNMIVDLEKIETCKGIATPSIQEEEETETDFEIDIDVFIDYVEEHGGIYEEENQTSSNESSSDNQTNQSTG
ncbi:hypothetical protein KKE92_00720 [Candidatus Micrarchaeota archaeon]|nr:hypothetical protein [Candidatus Micrarchaeota archaeon]MBU1682059.1 hypothetical protein [Candidatus Micrarchaeota archaeon]